ncbi:MAG TPA: SH3 domain-containing protein [Phototrophicaceae bacterium]|jgi:thiol-disulfide isomerase/thioredoxin|nr:SH3 domain-containing protein [Phototrophicaceae bacterium]
MRLSFFAIATFVLLLMIIGVTFAGTLSQHPRMTTDNTPQFSLNPTSPPALTRNLIATGERDVTTYPVRGAAPELNNLIWLNTDVPLRLANLRGQVVLLEFWTFDCINCIHTIPYVEQWYQTYQAQGLTVIGNHFPEYSFEHDVQNVRDALTRLNITYPVAIDNDGQTWDTYNQRYWPTIYLIDKWGDIRYMTIGEGRYNETEAAIQALIKETYAASSEIKSGVPVSAQERQYVTTDTVLNIHSGAGINYGIIGSIHPGMALIVLGESSGWYQISYNDTTGYVSGDKVRLNTR